MTPNSAEFTRLIELQSALTEADNLLASIEATVNPAVAETIAKHKAAWADAQAQRDEAEREIRLLAEAHPEWLEGKSIRTPFGAVSFRDTSKLDIPNIEATVALIRVHFPKHQMAPDPFIRLHEEPRPEVLETLGDDLLAKIGVTRVKSTSITVKPAHVDMAKESKPKKATAKPAVPAAKN
jgi:hypothetical protein